MCIIDILQLTEVTTPINEQHQAKLVVIHVLKSIVALVINLINHNIPKHLTATGSQWPIAVEQSCF